MMSLTIPTTFHNLQKPFSTTPVFYPGHTHLTHTPHTHLLTSHSSHLTPNTHTPYTHTLHTHLTHNKNKNKINNKIKFSSTQLTRFLRFSPKMGSVLFYFFRIRSLGFSPKIGFRLILLLPDKKPRFFPQDWVPSYFTSSG